MPAESKPANDAGEEALVDALLDEALAGFAGLVAPEVLREIRGCIEDRLRAHPEGRGLLRRALPDAHVEASGDVATDAASAEDGASEGDDTQAVGEEVRRR